MEKQFGDFLTHFASLGGDADGFRSLLVERQSLMMDIIAAAQAQGFQVGGGQGNSAVSELMRRSVREFNAHMRATVGEQAYQQFLKFEAGKPDLNVVRALEARLQGTAFELTGAQREQFLAALRAAREPNGTRIIFSVYGEDSIPQRMVRIPGSFLPIAKTMLSSQQFEHFSQVFDEQAEQRGAQGSPKR